MKNDVKPTILKIDLKKILTDKELEILQRLSTGKTYKEIAVLQGVKIDTVKKHCSHIYQKLSVRNKTEAILFYLRFS